jgi:transketolase
MRPADANEVLECYRAAMQLRRHPVAMVLSRQNVATLDRSKYGSAEGVHRGGYILKDCEGQPDCIVIGTGTEIGLCLQAADQLAKMGIAVRVVSMPCQELFDKQSREYRESVLPVECKLRIACEAGLRQGWDQYIGTEGYFVGMCSFGASAPAGTLYKHFKITADQIVALAQVGLQGVSE